MILYNSSPFPTYSCIEGWSGSGEGNIATEPNVEDAEALNFALLPESCLIDAGTTTVLMPSDGDYLTTTIQNEDERNLFVSTINKISFSVTVSGAEVSYLLKKDLRIVAWDIEKKYRPYLNKRL